MLPSTLLFVIIAAPSFAQQDSIGIAFDALNDSKNWRIASSNIDSADWTEFWFLDGEFATINNTQKGMYFRAGPTDGNDAHHAVLWTKKSFPGTIKIEFDYVKKDTMQKNVTILYIQATGIDIPPYDKDIFQWKNLRNVPSMRTYFKHMNTLHISYAAFSPQGNEYVRARRYPVSDKVSFKQMMIAPSYNNIKGLFKTDVLNHITVIKTMKSLFFKVENENNTQLFHWDIRKKAAITEGRIGLRHMFTRAALYKNFNVYTLKENEK